MDVFLCVNKLSNEENICVGELLAILENEFPGVTKKYSNSQSLLSSLPDELKLSLLKRLDFKDISKMAQISSDWKSITRDTSLWKFLYTRDFGETCPVKSPVKAYEERRRDTWTLALYPSGAHVLFPYYVTNFDLGKYNVPDWTRRLVSRTKGADGNIPMLKEELYIKKSISGSNNFTNLQRIFLTAVGGKVEAIFYNLNDANVWIEENSDKKARIIEVAVAKNKSLKQLD